MGINCSVIQEITGVWPIGLQLAESRFAHLVCVGIKVEIFHLDEKVLH